MSIPIIDRIAMGMTGIDDALTIAQWIIRAYDREIPAEEIEMLEEWIASEKS
jgi:hypothetical protein